MLQTMYAYLNSRILYIGYIVYRNVHSNQHINFKYLYFALQEIGQNMILCIRINSPLLNFVVHDNVF